VTVRLRRLPAGPLVLTGAVTGFVGGLFAGCLMGALLAWLAGAVLDWHRQLSFTLGVTEELLPLGEQVGLLQTVRDYWWLVVPLVGLAFGLINGLIGSLAGGLTAGLINRLWPGIQLEIDASSPTSHSAGDGSPLPRSVGQVAAHPGQPEPAGQGVRRASPPPP
jgi:hypothetical protein